MRRLVTVAAAAALLFLAPLQRAAAQAPPPPSLTAYVGAHMLDVRSGTLRRDVTIVERGGTIEAVLPAGTPPPSAATRVDVAGLYAIPGLIDVHLHIENGRGRAAAEALLRREIYSGVTAVRDMLGDARILGYLSRAARFEGLPAPDVDYAGMVAGPSYFIDGRLNDLAIGGTPGAVPWIQRLSADTDVALAVARIAGSGARGIKIYADLDAGAVRRLAAEAHRQGLKVWAHGAVFPATPREVAEAGADTLSHVCMLAYQTSKPSPSSYHDRAPLDQARLSRGRPDPELAALFAAMKARGVLLDTTIYVYHLIEKLRRELPGPKPPTYCDSALAERIAGQAFAAGVTLAAGTDGPAPAESAWPSLYDEMEMLGRAGLPPVEVIRAATLNGARALGREKDMGALEPGKFANIVFLSGNPLAGPAGLRSVVLTVKRGRAFRRKDYRPITPAQVGE